MPGGKATMPVMTSWVVSLPKSSGTVLFVKVTFFETSGSSVLRALVLKDVMSALSSSDKV